jgi:hypothetical protein
MLYLLILLFSLSAISCQLSILDNYDICNSFAVNGTGLSSIIATDSIFDLTLFNPGIDHVGYLVNTNTEVQFVQNGINSAFKLDPFVPLPALNVTGATYCGRTYNYLLNAYLTVPDQAFEEISQFTSFNGHFYSEWYKVHGPGLLYTAKLAISPCSEVYNHFESLNIPVFGKNPLATNSKLNIIGQTSYIRLPILGIYEIICVL